MQVSGIRAFQKKETQYKDPEVVVASSRSSQEVSGRGREREEVVRDGVTSEPVQNKPIDPDNHPKFAPMITKP